MRLSARGITLFVFLLASLCVVPSLLPAAPIAEVPAGTRFMVELRDKLDAHKVKAGKKFEARTVEAIQLNDGSIIDADAKVKGRVSYAERNKMVLRFERIETGREKLPIVATVKEVVGERDVQARTDDEGEISSSRRHHHGGVYGAAIGAGTGAVVGATHGGGVGAAIGTGVGAVTGGLIGAKITGHHLVLNKGTRLELELDRPLVFEARR